MNLTPKLIDMIKSIECKKYLIISNHDRKNLRNKEFRDLFVSIKDIMTVRDGDKTIVLSHYPMVEWRNSRKDDAPYLGYLIHGHIHNNYTDEYRYMLRHHNALNAGADVNGLEPVTFEEMIENNLRFKLSVLGDEDKAHLLSSINE